MQPLQSSSSPIKIAVIGVGHLGARHAQKIAQMAQADLVAVVDPDIAQGRAIAELYGVLAFCDVHALLADSRLKIDAAIIASPTTSHAQIASVLIERGIHVLIEKPVVACEDEADQLLELQKRHPQVVIHVGHVERFNPALCAARPLLKTPLYIVAERMGPFKARSTDIDVIDDLMIHDLDLCLSCVGEQVTEIRAVGVPIMTPQIDMANARLEFAGGAVASLTASRASLESSRKLRLFTRDCYASLDLERKEGKLVRRLLPDHPDYEAKLEGWPQIEAQLLEIDHYDALLMQDKAFVLAILKGEAAAHQDVLPARLVDGVSAVKLAARIKSSLRSVI